MRKSHRKGPHVAVAVLCRSKALRKRFKERPKDVSSGRNEHYTAKYPLIDIEQRS